MLDQKKNAKKPRKPVVMRPKSEADCPAQRGRKRKKGYREECGDVALEQTERTGRAKEDGLNRGIFLFE